VRFRQALIPGVHAAGGGEAELGDEPPLVFPVVNPVPGAMPDIPVMPVTLIFGVGILSAEGRPRPVRPPRVFLRHHARENLVVQPLPKEPRRRILFPFPEVVPYLLQLSVPPTTVHRRL